MAKQETLEFKAKLNFYLTMFRVKLENNHEISAHTAGKLARTAQVLAGDNVMVEMTPYDLTKGRITLDFRL